MTGEPRLFGLPSSDMEPSQPTATDQIEVIKSLSRSLPGERHFGTSLLRSADRNESP